MPRVTHVQSARKDNPVCSKGESYYWWKFRFGGKLYSLTYPRPSQLTQSAYKSTCYDLADQISDFKPDGSEPQEVIDQATEFLEDVRTSIEELRDECQESVDNMPESLQEGPTGELLNERVSACEEADNDIDSAVSEVESVDFDDWVDPNEEVDPEDEDEDEDDDDKFDFDAFTDEVAGHVHELDIGNLIS